MVSSSDPFDPLDPVGPPNDDPNALRTRIKALVSADRLLVASDYDGVLAPIADDPAATEALPASMDALGQLSELADTQVALISGRPLSFLRALPSVPPAAWLAGSHGNELGHVAALGPDGRDEQILHDLRVQIDRIAEHFPGCLAEHKPKSSALHYRHVDPRHWDAVRTHILNGPGRLPGVSVQEGKMVIELGMFTGDKGTALSQIRREAMADTCVFIGDDVTDEAAFLGLQPQDMGVKVGPGPTAASARVADPHAAAELLQLIAHERIRALGLGR